MQGVDRHGKRQLPNHKLFDPDNENQREEFFYSLVLLFSPFRDESSLLHDKETAEQAFQRLLSNKITDYHDKLKTMLAAASNVKTSMMLGRKMARRKRLKRMMILN